MCLHILDINPLSDVQLCLHSIDCFFAIQRIFTFVRSHLSIVSFDSRSNGPLFRKPFSTPLFCRILLMLSSGYFRFYIEVFIFQKIVQCIFIILHPHQFLPNPFHIPTHFVCLSLSLKKSKYNQKIRMNE